MHGFLISPPGHEPISSPGPEPISGTATGTGTGTVSAGAGLGCGSGSGSGGVSKQPPRSMWLEQQQRQVKEEKARLTRLQELSEVEARLEEQLQRELVEERR